MCFGGGGGGNAVEDSRRIEAERAERVRQGTADINQQFAGFNDAFFGGIEQNALNFFNPDLQRQFTDTREGLIKNLARSGNLQGSAGAIKLGELNAERARQQALIGDKAKGFAQQARADVENTRSNLIQNLAATADPFAASQAANAQAVALTAPPEFSPLGDVFTKFTNLATPQIIGRNRGFNNSFATLFGPGAGSATDVRT